MHIAGTADGYVRWCLSIAPEMPKKVTKNGEMLTMIDDFMAEVTFAALKFAPEMVGTSGTLLFSSAHHDLLLGLLEMSTGPQLVGSTSS